MAVLIDRLVTEATKPARVFPVLRMLTRHDGASSMLTRALTPFNPFNPRRYIDPYPLYDELRTVGGPVYFQKTTRAWLVTGYPEIEQILRSSVSVARDELLADLPPYKHLAPRTTELLSNLLLMLDPPDHTRLRQLVGRAFTPRAIAELEPEIWRVANQLLDDINPNSPFDAASGYASQLPIYMIGQLLGLPAEDWPRLKELSDLASKFADPLSGFDPGEMDRTLAELEQLFRGHIADRRAHPTNDLLSALIAAEEDGDRLSETELISMITLLMVAGHETTTGLISNGLLLLDRHPEARQLWLDRPDVGANAIEEMLRFDSPVQGTDRIVLADIEVDGQTIRKGSVTVLLIGAANRDPRLFDAPDELRLDRVEPRPLSFGHGIHHCIGAALARLEGRVAIEAFLERFPDYRVDEQAITWKRSIVLRGPAVLTVNPSG